MRWIMPDASLSEHLDAAAVAGRVRQLLTNDVGDNSDAFAGRLRVSADALRLTTDVDHPQPTLDVLIAVVREFGVDPMWLLTGVYDAATHRAVLDERSGDVERVVTSLTNGEASS